MKTNMNFKLFVEIIKNKAIIFREGHEWSIDKWNETYIIFKDHASRMSSAYVFSTEVEELVIEWAKDFYSPANPDTHNYWIKYEVGDKVRYSPDHYEAGKFEKGIVKSIPDHTNESIRVVYNCDGNWDKYKKYTSALTSLRDIVRGW